MNASNDNCSVTYKDQKMGIKLQLKIGARNKLKRKIHLQTHTALVRVKVGLKEARRQKEARGLQIMIQLMILVQKDQVREEMLVDLAQMLNQIGRQLLRNLTEVLEKLLLQWLNGKR